MDICKPLDFLNINDRTRIENYQKNSKMNLADIIKNNQDKTFKELDKAITDYLDSIAAEPDEHINHLSRL